MNEIPKNDDGYACGSVRCYRPIVLAVISFVLVLGFFVLREYWSQMFGFASYLLLIVCPLLHLFHCHGCHRCHGYDEDEVDNKRGGCCR